MILDIMKHYPKQAEVLAKGQWDAGSYQSLSNVLGMTIDDLAFSISCKYHKNVDFGKQVLSSYAAIHGRSLPPFTGQYDYYITGV